MPPQPPARCALITGAASGIGRAVALAVADLFETLYLLDHDRDGLEEVGTALAVGAACRPIALAVDLRDDHAIRAAFTRIAAAEDALDALVNNAGVAFLDHLEIPDASVWEHLLDTNLFAVWRVTQEALPLLKVRGGDIVNISSTAGARPIKYQAVYSATKAGVDAFAEALRDEVKGDGIRISTIAPGPTRSRILRHFPPELIEELGILDEPRIDAADVADVVRFVLTRPPGVSLDRLTITPTLWSDKP
jgi:NADP-dependent 3-hydroxy acid dehydrogenase YdfG